MPRSARFEVSWFADPGATELPAGEENKDYLVLEVGAANLRRLKESIDLAFQVGCGSDDGLTCFLFHGRAHPQRGDREDGTTTWPPSLLSDEVIAESPRPQRWKPVPP